MNIVASVLTLLAPKAHLNPYDPESYRSDQSGQRVSAVATEQPLKEVINSLKQHYGQEIATAVSMHSFSVCPPESASEIMVAPDEINAANDLAKEFTDLLKTYGEEARKYALKAIEPVEPKNITLGKADLLEKTKQKADEFVALNLVIFILAPLPPKERRAFINRLRDPATKPIDAIAHLQTLVLALCEALESYYENIEESLPESVQDLKLHYRLIEPIRQQIEPEASLLLHSKDGSTNNVNIVALFKKFQETAAKYSILFKEKIGWERLLKRETSNQGGESNEEMDDWELVSPKEMLEDIDAEIDLLFQGISQDPISQLVIKTYTYYKMIAKGEIASSHIPSELHSDIERFARITAGNAETIDNLIRKEARTVLALLRDAAIEQNWTEVDTANGEDWATIHPDEQEDWDDALITEHSILQASAAIRDGDDTSIEAIVKKHMPTKEEKLKAIQFLKERQKAVLDDGPDGLDASAFDAAHQELLRFLEAKLITIDRHSLVAQWILGKPTAEPTNPLNYSLRRFKDGHDGITPELEGYITSLKSLISEGEGAIKNYNEEIRLLESPYATLLKTVVDTLLPPSTTSLEATQLLRERKINDLKRHILFCTSTIEEAKPVLNQFIQLKDVLEKDTTLVENSIRGRNKLNELSLSCIGNTSFTDTDQENYNHAGEAIQKLENEIRDTLQTYTGDQDFKTIAQEALDKAKGILSNVDDVLSSVNLSEKHEIFILCREFINDVLEKCGKLSALLREIQKEDAKALDTEESTFRDTGANEGVDSDAETDSSGSDSDPNDLS